MYYLYIHFFLSFQMQLFVLFEHASGYGLFSVQQFEEVGAFLPQVEEAVSHAAKFQQVVKLVGFRAFTSAAQALENMNAVSEGELQNHVGKGGRGRKCN